jgi:RNA polymerase sigma-70 factor (ECF subfamily)
MSWPSTLPLFLQSPDPRPVRVVEQEILDELEFHIEMRTLDNVRAGMSADDARQDAVRRFGDFERIHKRCRQTLLGERIMLQRVQAVLTLVLLGAVIVLGVQVYRGQQATAAATADMMDRLAQMTGPMVVETVPKTGATDVDPSLTEIRATYNKDMSADSFSWCGDPANGYPETTGDPHYDAKKKTWVLPVKLEPGKTYTIRLNSGQYQAFMDVSGRPAIPYLLQFTTRK